MDYTKVDDNYYWSGDARKGMHFNELVSVRELPGLDTEASEHISDYDAAYQYVLNMICIFLPLLQKQQNIYRWLRGSA